MEVWGQKDWKEKEKYQKRRTQDKAFKHLDTKRKQEKGEVKREEEIGKELDQHLEGSAVRESV